MAIQSAEKEAHKKCSQHTCILNIVVISLFFSLPIWLCLLRVTSTHEAYFVHYSIRGEGKEAECFATFTTVGTIPIVGMVATIATLIISISSTVVESEMSAGCASVSTAEVGCCHL